MILFFNFLKNLFIKNPNIIYQLLYIPIGTYDLSQRLSKWLSEGAQSGENGGWKLVYFFHNNFGDMWLGVVMLKVYFATEMPVINEFSP